MPIYEYRCGKCGFQQETLQRINEPPLTKCPECGKQTFKKMVTAAGFQLKGTGWYATDFKNSGSASGKKAKQTDVSSDSGAKEGSSGKESKSKDSAKSDPGGGASASAT